MSHIFLSNVYKSYHKDQFVVKNLSLHIFEGEFLVLVGPSGCGKTTTLRMIAGLEELSKGDLMIDGENYNEKDPSKRALSFVFQNYALLPYFTVEDNLSFGLLSEQIDTKEKKRRVELLAKDLGLFAKLGNYPHQLSGGQRQRVALGRALIDQRKLILFDEPLSNLDALLRVEMRGELLRLHHEFKMTSVYVTHDQIEAMAMADRMVMMDQGVILQVGTPYQMYHDPQHLKVAEFIGQFETNTIQFQCDNHTFNLNLDKYDIELKWMNKLKELNIKEGYLTIRPDQVKIIKEKSKGSIPARFNYIEYFGSKKLITFEALGLSLRVLVDQDMEVSPEFNIELSQNFFLFDESFRRIRLDEPKKIIINKESKDLYNISVIDEIKNYGYEIIYDEKNPDIMIDGCKISYKHQGTWTMLKSFKDALSYLSYIK